ncbi:follicle-stimulating hormone receptor-like [Stylophora pistillata]|uniref:follicle-stimulating hormone receptor-like n=1 Tax=Stylophora pistillata TaxID=50429 RepID=UPI000C03D30F|nr:follicle-stimulating hormone receptor-like [Stylophora pistillata]
MSDTSDIVILCIICIESLVIFIGNTFTIFVFWNNRKKLKRTAFLLINLAIADLLVGLIQMITMGGYTIILRQIQTNSTRESVKSRKWILAAQQVLSPFASILFLVLISLERAYALIWPLHHRVASMRGYIYSAIFTWLAAIALQTLYLFGVYCNVLDLKHLMIALSCIEALSLILICVCYMTIRARLSSNGLTTVAAKNNSLEQNKKLSRTFFTVSAASLVCWGPSSVAFLIFHLSSKTYRPNAIIYSSCILYLGNS